MGDIHYLPTNSATQQRLLEKLVTDTIGEHPDPAVAVRWAKLARETLRKYPGPPSPTRTQLDLGELGTVDDATRQRIVTEVKTYVESYFNDVRDQLMHIHGDILLLQKEIAELELRETRTRPHSD